MNKTLKKNMDLVILILASTLVRIISSALVSPGYDEAYYGVYAMFPACGFFDHPPLVLLSSGFGLWIFNIFNALVLRLGAIILYIFSTILVFLITKELFNRKAAIYSVILFIITPFFLVGIGAFVIPDNFLTFFWLLAIFAMVKFQKSDNNLWLILWGVSLGLGFLSKYHVVLLLAGFGWSLLFNQRFRRLWSNVWFYISIILSLVVILPNILWNYQHGWISYIYQFGKSGGSSSISLVKFYQGVLSQIAYLLPWNFVILILGFKELKKKKKWLIPIALFPIIIFTIFGLKQQILPHWPMSGYLTLVIPAGYFLSKWKHAKIYVILSSVTTIIILAIILIQAQTGFMKLKPKIDVTLDGFGWKELIKKVEEKDYFADIDFLASHKWFTSGELMFASKGKYKVIAINPKDPRGFAFWQDLNELENKNCLFVSTNRYYKNPKERYPEYFQTINPIDTIYVERRDNQGKSFYLWQCKGFKNNLFYPYGINKRNEKDN